MKQWMHLVLIPRDYKKLIDQWREETKFSSKPSGSFKKLISYFKAVIEALSPVLIDRYFYTIQFDKDNPHIPFSLELKDGRDINRVKHIIDGIKLPEFIISKKYDDNGHDEGNGEGTINFLNAITNLAFFRVSNEFEIAHKNNEIKLVHHFCNSLFLPHEFPFYLYCVVDRLLLIYQGVKRVTKIKAEYDDGSSEDFFWSCPP